MEEGGVLHIASRAVRGVTARGCVWLCRGESSTQSARGAAAGVSE